MLDFRALPLLAALAINMSAIAGAFDSGSDGSDGPFNPVVNVEIDLGLADTGSWDTPGNGNGVYDPDRWIVVFKLTTIDIPPGVTVTFLNHPSGAPVVWLAQGDVVIDGTVSLNGEAGTFVTLPYQYAKGGPGGFDGGAALVTGFALSEGFGPDGGSTNGGGSYTYCNPSIFPLIGGSGGGGSNTSNRSGGAGGGAILIAASGTISHFGLIEANGGANFVSSGSGSGGGVRLVANTIVGTGALTAMGGIPNGGSGRIRLEAFDPTGYTGSTNPLATISGPGPLVQDNLTPTLRVTMVDGQPVPADPTAGVLTKEVVADNDVVTLTIQATNITPGTVVTVRVRPAHGAMFATTSTPLVGTFALTTATAIVSLPAFPAEIQLRATF